MRGFLFSMDALLGGLLLIGGIMLVVSFSAPQQPSVQVATASTDLMAALTSIRLYEISDPWVQEAIENGSIPDANLTALEQIGYFWAVEDLESAQQLAALLLQDQSPSMGVRLRFEGDTIFERNSTFLDRDVGTSSRMVTGIASGQAVTGSTASAYLRRIKDRRTSDFTVFGGFVGQGNISMRVLTLPADANITSIVLEAAAGSPFDVYLNRVHCNQTLVPPSNASIPGRWDLSACNTSITAGTTNLLTINFTNASNVSFLAGGFLQVKYKTETVDENISNTTRQYRFPGINGIANLFDGFYVPGTLLNLTVYLHYNATNNTYLDIGEQRVFQIVGNDTEKIIVLNDSYLRDPLGGRLDYDLLSNNTVPIRFAGFEPNITTITSGDADVVLITDFSGSMKKAVSDWDQGNLGTDCAGAYTDNDVRRTLLAQCVDNVLVDTVMNYSGNRIWPVFIHKDAIKWYNNPTDADAIKGYIDSYPNGDGKTCYACAINFAHEVLQNFSNSSRKKFIVFMTDGCPTHCALGGCASNSSSFGTKQCEGLCDTNGACDDGDIPGQCAACTTNNGGQTNAYLAANRTRQLLNATIFTVGFGPVDDCALATETLNLTARFGNGTYQHSTSSAQLKLIYENISQEILSRTSLVAQVAMVEGNASRSILYEDSHINITFLPAEQYTPRQNMIGVTLQTSPACNPTLELFDGQQLVEALGVSYSGTHWTDYLGVNGVEAYNLSTYYAPYGDLGDPTLIYAPITLFSQGANTLRIETGDSPTNRSGCSPNNTAIYTVLVNLSTERSAVVPDAEGCNWTVEFDDLVVDTLMIPASYVGANQCNYTNTSVIYDPDDAYQRGTFEILNRLDFRRQGRLFVNLREEDLEIVVTTIGGVPYLWGPSIATLEVTR